jgi:hypothetical protein
MAPEVTFAEIHERVIESPCEIVLSLAESAQEGTFGGGGMMTTTVTSHVATPPGPVAVPVYMVVCVGKIFLVPCPTGDTLPTPLFTTRDVAFKVVHSRTTWF